jgi:hypothetical protein
MRELLNRRPDQPLPPGVHDKLRTELLDALDAEQPRTPRRVLVPIAAAAAVLAVAAGLAVAVPALKKDDSGTPVAGQASIRDLPATERANLRTQCLDEANRITANGIKKPFREFEIVRAVEFPGVKDPKLVNTWLIGKGTETVGKPIGAIPAEKIDYYWLCSRTAGGVISESSLRTTQQQILGGDPIRTIARNAGLFAGPVDRVTVQVPGRPAVDAFLVDGFWMAPTEGRTGWGPYDADDPLRSAYVVRGYAGGRQVYDSSKPAKPCYVVYPERPGYKQLFPSNQPRCTDSYPWPS